MQTGFIWLRIGANMANCFECYNKTSCSTKSLGFLNNWVTISFSERNLLWSQLFRICSVLMMKYPTVAPEIASLLLLFPRYLCTHKKSRFLLLDLLDAQVSVYIERIISESQLHLIDRRPNHGRRRQIFFW